MTRLPAWLVARSASAQPHADRWENLPHPVPGYSSIDGLPVAVVAVRRDGASGRLDVIRGLYPSAEWPEGAAAPAAAQRHAIPAASFIPHPRREIIIADQRFVYSTVARQVRCSLCAREDLGFAFCGSEVPLTEQGPVNTDHSTLCEHCAERQLR
jgi:hypothetical protein